MRYQELINRQSNIVKKVLVIALATIPASFWLNFLTILLANTVGNMSQRAWAELSLTPEPCGRPGCDCEKDRAALLAGLTTLRESHQKVIRHKTPHG
ncbi:hypothetical protein GCM10023213_14250 [Prosthecobacter algae]|uniref:Uncharacterized protein n=1 Tax=Prosthecobacter algae TaxID=1144682 RepID=A0ABP9NZK4_9BACT